MVSIKMLMKIFGLCSLIFTLYMISYIDLENEYADMKTKPLLNTNDKSLCDRNFCSHINPHQSTLHIIPYSIDLDQYIKSSIPGLNQLSISNLSYLYTDYDAKGLLISIIYKLHTNPQRKFLISDLSFFDKWWNTINDEQKLITKQLIERGQLIFVSGGYIINDEATVHYSSIIDQISVGHQFLKSHFGPCSIPKVGWQIETFGHSIEMARLLKEMDYTSLFIARISELQNHRILTSEFKWYFSPDKPDDYILTSIIRLSYCPSRSACLDSQCNAIDNVILTRIANEFLEFLKSSRLQMHTVILLNCDMHNNEYLKLMDTFDKMLSHKILKNNGVKIAYSTPNCYFKALNQTKYLTNTYNNDFFPHYTKKHGYFIGYYSTKSYFKYNIRKFENIIRTSKKLLSINDKSDKKIKTIIQHHFDLMSKYHATLMHFSCITGISGREISFYGIKYLRKMLTTGLKEILNGLESLMAQRASTKHLKMVYCNIDELHYCSITDDIMMNRLSSIIVFNQLPYYRTVIIAVPVKLGAFENYAVVNSWDIFIKANIVPIDRLILKDKSRPKRSKAKSILMFKVILPEFGFHVFYIRRKRMNFWDITEVVPLKHVLDKTNISNSIYTISFNDDSDLFEIYRGNYIVNISISFNCFCENDNNEQNVKLSDTYTTHFGGNYYTIKTKLFTYSVNGSLVKEVRRKYSKGMTLILRLYENEDYIEVEYSISNTIVVDNFNQEYTLSYQSELLQSTSFYTDTNGRNLINRIKNFNSDTESNFYPVTQHVLFGGNNQNDIGVLIHTDRSIGVGYVDPYALHFMINRIVMNGGESSSNNRGTNSYNSNLDFDPDRRSFKVSGKHYIQINQFKTLKINRRIFSNEILNQPIIYFKKANVEDFYVKVFSCLTEQPKHLNILNLEPLAFTDEVQSVLLRLENLKDLSYEEDENRLNTLNINLLDFFDDYNVTNAFEMNLLGTKNLSKPECLFGFQVILRPMRIVTLHVNMLYLDALR